MIISLCRYFFCFPLFCITMPLKKCRIIGFISFIFFIPLCSPVPSPSPPLLFFTPLHHPSFPLHPGDGSEPPLKLTCWKPRSLGLSAAALPLTGVCAPYAAFDSLQGFLSQKKVRGLKAACDGSLGPAVALSECLLRRPRVHTAYRSPVTRPSLTFPDPTSLGLSTHAFIRQS